MTEQQPRPGQATLAGALIIGGSIVLVLSAWQRISTLHTLEVQQEFERMLGDQPSGMGISVDTLATIIRILCLVGAGAAAASTILGFQVFKRSISARVALTALSPLLLIGGLATAGFLAPMVVAGIGLLWLQPTRDWYAGRPWVQRTAPRRSGQSGDAADGAGPVAPPVSPWTTPSTPTPPTVPPAAETQPGPPAAGPVPVPVAPWPHDRPRRQAAAPRPGALVTACVLAWVFSTVTVAFLALSALALAAQGDDVFAELQKQQPDLAAEMTKGELVASMYVVIAGLIVWSLAVIVLAGVAFVGQNWARILLAVSAAVAGLLSLVMAIAAPPLVIVVLVFAVATWLLLRPEVSAWYRR